MTPARNDRNAPAMSGPLAGWARLAGWTQRHLDLITRVGIALIGLLLYGYLRGNLRDYFGVLAWRTTNEFAEFYDYILGFWLLSAVAYAAHAGSKFAFVITSAAVLSPAYFWIMLRTYFQTGSWGEYALHLAPIILVTSIIAVRSKDWKSAAILNLLVAASCLTIAYQQFVGALY